ncbi:MAG TPA: hypothetical protein VF487_06435 [Chitinophagaceae bacterium]
MNKICIVVLLIAFSKLSNSQSSLELNAGNKRIAAYVKGFRYIDKSKRWSIYSNNRVAANYETGKPGFFSTNILAYHFRNGIGIGAILMAGNNKLRPATGFQYQKTIRSFYLYFLSTYELNKFTRQENYLTLVYKHKLSKKVKLVFHYENYICFLKWGYDQSFQRIRSGLEIKKTQVGFISETSQTGKTHKTSLINLGFFIKQTF